MKKLDLLFLLVVTLIGWLMYEWVIQPSALERVVGR